MFSLDDTIVAISTPIGTGGIGIVRLSGPEAANIVQRLFVPHAARDGAHLAPRRLAYGHIVDPATGKRIDETLVAYMPAPQTFTRQDVVEINGHGGIVALRQVLSLCLRHGCRLAESGEFTARAFLNGRIDLTQAEAVLDIVTAKTETSLEAAIGQLSGQLSDAVRSARITLVDALAYLEACIDFAEDEIPSQDIGPDLRQAKHVLVQLLTEAERGVIYRQGVRVAIVGRPNVGKSSLLNRLLRANRAIVTNIPGTTRDTLEETLNLEGIPVVLVDTAGITSETVNEVERLGIERSRAALDQSDLALLVIDASQPLTPADYDIAQMVVDQPAIVAYNKMDLVNGTVDPSQTHSLPVSSAVPSIPVSAQTGEGILDLEDTIVASVLNGTVQASHAPTVTNPRHKEALSRALEHVEAAQTAYQDGHWTDLIAIDVSAAIHALGEITGQTASEDLIETIFSSFCVGK